MILLVAIVFEGDILQADAISDTGSTLGACFHGWHISDSLPLIWGITGGDAGGGLSSLVALALRETTEADLRVRQAFCSARKLLYPFYDYGGVDEGWLRVFPGDELYSCGEIVLRYLKERYPEAFNYRCKAIRMPCYEQEVQNFREYLFKDIALFLKEVSKDSTVHTVRLSNNVAIVVLLYEFLTMYAEYRGFEALKTLAK